MPAFRPVAAAVATLALGLAALVGVHTAHISPVASTAVAAKGHSATATVEHPVGAAVNPRDMIWQ
ncbi:hypothetical protein ABZW47_16495 [Streptomyces sp. NPDC004549]|uniref:hypothetical protein n=1 Tax=Streptomyces sp. NPDC004549 TaxID=3154283 RepID=UPI0033AA9DA6